MINILEVSNLFNSKNITNKEIKQYLDIGNIKEQEIEDLNKLCEIFKNVICDCSLYNHHIFDNYYINYEIPQIGKEFDLLRIGKCDVVNIELKSQKDEDKILKQLQRNYCYLLSLKKSIYCFTFVSKTKELYRYNRNIDGIDNIEIITAEEVIKIINQINDIECNINDLFMPSKYLVSPFNSTERFLNNKYFLTLQQEEIKYKIIELIKNSKCKIFSIAGSAGTGKTLLTYDIAKTLIRQEYNVAILHCALSNEGIDILKQNKWNIIVIRDFRIKQIKSDILIVDESQRLALSQINDIINTNKILIFSHDINQKLNKYKETKEVVSFIIEKASEKYILSDKIRTNKAIALFIKQFLGLNKTIIHDMSSNYFKDVSFYYANNDNDAKCYIDYLQENGWKYIHLTPSKHKSDKLHKVIFASKLSAHEAIGQEFDNVIAVITSDFYYDDSGKLKYGDNSYHYQPLETLFQVITRTRKQLKIVIINNPDIYRHCMEIVLRRDSFPKK